MSIKRSIVIGEPKAASTSKDTEKKNTKKESTTIKRKVTKEALTPMGIVRDKSVLQTSVPPEQREPRVYNPNGKVLVIVESPAKSKTIEKFLGPNYVVKASMGHLRDLPKSQMGIDIEHGFTPRYSNLVTRKKVIDELVSYADESSAVLLATDPDREGEAISWHLAYILNVDPKSTCRITFNEITKNAVAEALEAPRTIDMNMVDAQQARRVLDRIVGYKLSPLLWKKVCKGLSAGRVQSVAVRLICEREREIQAFEPQEYWTIKGNFETPKKESFTAELTHIKGEKIDITTESDAQAVVDAIGGEDAVVTNIEKRKRSRKAAPPFTTSTLQQDGVRKLNFGAKGLITYMRTDSTRISKEMQVMAKDFILRNYGEEYYPSKPNVYGSKGSAQDAHEAIRPTSLELTPKMVEPFLSRDELKLYTLIWNRFMASQMAPQQNESTTIELNVKDDYTFKATGSRVIFPGFSAVYEDVKKEDAPQLPALKKNDAAHTVEVLPEQHFTQPPPRYSEASLIKTLEELGIGRPSTYAPILDTIVSRNYVENTNKQFVPTELGFVVVDFLITYFEKIINTGFTRDLEEELDAIASGKDTYVKVLSDFYEVFAQELEDASDVENTKPITVGTGVTCPKCKEGEIVERKSRRGRIFYGCNRYPQCDFTLWDKPTHDFCETCGSIMVEKTYKNGTVKKFCSNEEETTIES
ncbi:MAG: type I DNA topoisomerase [Veillonella sp.]|nr:type I DNA topoisomerase [Veillonella sp.]